MIFNSGSSQGQGKKDSGDGSVAMAMFCYATRLHVVGEGSSSSLSSMTSSPETENASEENSKNIMSFTINLINPQTRENLENSVVEELLKELIELYVHQMVLLRDKAARNLNNIKLAKRVAGYRKVCRSRSHLKF